ncbi:hypothetical protein GQ55_5G038000 [Panicum hallii var. hallii]|uniref:Uncharacterized protein n=1 Tax=Panicum hallii var. hallii TaxID=1504633 RepID=A0A2T7DCE8_9POAL|nr:hypothetical protein GQ55_5G038000 [Panicum hallii var. hallii]
MKSELGCAWKHGTHAKPTGAVLYPTMTCKTAEGGYIGFLSPLSVNSIWYGHPLANQQKRKEKSAGNDRCASGSTKLGGSEFYRTTQALAWRTKRRTPERRVPAAEANASPRPKRRGAPRPLGRRYGGLVIWSSTPRRGTLAAVPSRSLYTRANPAASGQHGGGLGTAQPQGNNGGVTGLRKPPRRGARRQ